jgi:hypothetical protein
MARMTSNRVLTSLAVATAILAAIAAGVGLLWDGGTAPTSVTSIRGDTVQLFGHGLYRYDTLLVGAGFRGVDLVILVIGVPLLLAATVLHRRGSLRGHLLLTGALAFFLYDYASMAVGAAYNELFLVYIALVATCLFGFVIAFATVDLDRLGAAVAPTLRVRVIAGFLFITFAGLAVLWLGPIVAGLADGKPPAILGTYTTIVTFVVDLAVVAPAILLAGLLILRRLAIGYLLASTVLVITLLLAPALIAMTVFQLGAGVTFTPGEVVGPVASFTVIGVIGMALAVVLLRAVNPTERAR